MKCKKWLYLLFLLWSVFLVVGGQFELEKAETIILAMHNHPPFFNALLGTDQLGRDILARTLVGGSISLLVGMGAAVLAMVIGVTVGLVSGYYGGLLDSILMRFIDAVRAVPTLILLIFWQSLSKPSLMNVVVIIAVFSWLQAARIIRSEVLSLKEREHVAAARAIACPVYLILWRHILPYCSGRVYALFILEFSRAVSMETTLSFLGLGLPSNVPSLGNMLSNGLTAIHDGYWWQVLFPGITLVITILLIHACGVKFHRERC